MKSEVSALFPKPSRQLFCQSFLCHDWMLRLIPTIHPPSEIVTRPRLSAAMTQKSNGTVPLRRVLAVTGTTPVHFADKNAAQGTMRHKYEPWRNLLREVDNGRVQL
jgi:hypothetical protein